MAEPIQIAPDDPMRKMSREELMKIASGGEAPKATTAPPSVVAADDPMRQMSREDLLKIANSQPAPEVVVTQPAEKGILVRTGDALLSGLGAVGRVYDSYAGAPTRAAIGAALDGGGLSGAVSRYKAQFGEDPSLAPSGAELVDKSGVQLSKVGTTLRIPVMPGQVTLAEGAKPSEEGVDVQLPSQRDVAGAVVDIAADPTNIIPVSAAIKVAGRGVGKLGVLAGTVAERAIAPLKEMATARAAKAVLEGGKSAFDKLLNPTVSPEWSEFKAIAEKNGINPKLLSEEHEFGNPSLIARSARQQRAGVLGEPSYKQFVEGLEETRNAVDRKIVEIGRGEVMDPVTAGEYIRKGYDDAYHEFFDTVDTSYNTIVKEYPGLVLSANAEAKLASALNGVEKYAKGRVVRGVTQTMRAQGEGLLNSVAAIREGNGSVKQTVEALRDIGEAAFTSKNSLAAIPPDVNKLRKLYFDVTDALHTTIREDVTDGAKISDALKESNARMSEWFGEKSIVADSIGNKTMAPEKVFSSLILSGDTRKIQALNFILGPERMQKLKASALGDLVASAEGKNGLEFGTLRNKIKGKRNVLGELLDPQEAAEVSDLVRLGEGFGNPILSAPDTEGAIQMSKLAKGVPETLVNQSTLEALKKRARAADINKLAAEGGARIEAAGLVEKVAAVKEAGTVTKLRKALAAPVGANRTVGDLLLKGAATYEQTENAKKKDAMKRRAGEK